MRLSPEAIHEFKEICLIELGDRISDEEAQELGGSLLSIFSVIYRIVPAEDKRRILEEIKRDLNQ